MSPSLAWAAILVLLALVAPPSDCAVTLVHLDTVYMPETYDETGSPRFRYDTGAAYVVAFDPNPQKQFIYVAGESVIHVIEYSKPEELKRAETYHQSDAGFTYTAVDACVDVVAVSFDHLEEPLSGMVYIFRSFDGFSFTLLQQITVGAQPAMVKFTADCKRLLVPLTGGVVMVDGQVTDPEGQVAIIRLTKGGADHELTIVDFTKFNEKWQHHVDTGVRWPWRGQGANINTTFSQGLEPWYITIDNGTTAYVCLQTNNAIATLNVATEEITELYPLGTTSWKSSTFDPSDRDSGINMNSWDVYGMYQPQSVRLFSLSASPATHYVLTADAGHYTKHEHADLGFDWADWMKGKDLKLDHRLSENMDAELIDDLIDERKLGRLRISDVDGLDHTGNISELHTFGARSFSILKASDMSQVYNSRNSLESKMAEFFPDAFNAKSEDEARTPASSMDSMSNELGPNPVSVEYAEVHTKSGLKKLVFVGAANPGSVSIYSLGDDFASSKEVTFESMHYNGGDPDDTWGYSWEERVSRDLLVNDLKVLPASRSPNGRPLLAVAGHATGTVSLYSIQDDDDNGGGSGMAIGAKIGIVVVCIVVVGVAVAIVVRYTVAYRRRKENYGATRLQETLDTA